MAVRGSRGALAALALAGLAYFFRNRKKVNDQVQQLTDKVQQQFGSNNSNQSTNQSNEPRAYTGETTRM